MAITTLTFVAAYFVPAIVFVLAKQTVGQTGNDLDDRLLSRTPRGLSPRRKQAD